MNKILYLTTCYLLHCLYNMHDPSYIMKSCIFNCTLSAIRNHKLCCIFYEVCDILMASQELHESSYLADIQHPNG